MFILAILIGIYSYLILLLGLLGFFYNQIIIFVSIFYLFAILFFLRKKIKLSSFKKKLFIFVRKSSKLEKILLIIIFSQSLVNMVGVLGPELGFDALWYHLTLPKIFLQMHAVVHVPGSLLYYSDMPKLTEMLYVSSLSFGTEIVAKLIHFSFGILSLVALYNLSRKFLSKTFSFLVLVLFYSNLVVGWMSITAYIDLARTFFEIMALWGFVEWYKKKESKWLIESAIMLGFAISTKLLAMESLSILTVIFIVYSIKRKDLLLYWFFALFMPLPWFIFSYIHTGNPVYPFFTSIYPVKFNLNLINPLNLPDPISPLYVIFLPITIFLYRKFKPTLRMLSLYSFLAIAIWYLVAQTGGGRFILPYLPVFSIITVAAIGMISKNKIKNIFIGAIIFLSLFSIIYRFGANLKYIPVILGAESKSKFLTDNLNFSFGDFYDIDGYFKGKIKASDIVLLYGFHNLYYVNFPFIDSSYVRKGDRFNYIAVQGSSLPDRFKNWSQIYYNSKASIRVYTLGGIKWIY